MRKTKLFSAALCAAALAGLASGPAAGAHAGERSLAQTFPLATRLCAAISRGEGPKRLRPSAAAVEAACAQLQSSFTADQNVVLTAVSPLQARLAAQQVRTHNVCSARPLHLAACETARRRRRRLLALLEAERRRRAHAYYAAVEADRAAFWAAVHALPGGLGLAGDRPVIPQST